MEMNAEIDRLVHGFATATTHLMTISDGHGAIQAALESLGSALNADRSYIFERHPQATTGEMVVSQRWEWVAKGIPPQYR